MKTIAIKWSTDDVLALAKEKDILLTEKEADEILDNVHKNHDAYIGINWETIEAEINDYVDYKIHYEKLEKIR